MLSSLRCELGPKGYIGIEQQFSECVQNPREDSEETFRRFGRTVFIIMLRFIFLFLCNDIYTDGIKTGEGGSKAIGTLA